MSRFLQVLRKFIGAACSWCEAPTFLLEHLDLESTFLVESYSCGHLLHNPLVVNGLYWIAAVSSVVFCIMELLYRKT